MVMVVSLNLSFEYSTFWSSLFGNVPPSIMALPTTVASVDFMTPIKMDAMPFPPKASESRQSRSLGYLNQDDSRLKDILINM